MSSVDEKIRCFEELVKSGYSVGKAQKECRLSSQQYKKYYDLIWSDPEMELYRPRRSFEISSSQSPQGSENLQVSEEQHVVKEIDKLLTGLGDERR